MFGQFLVQEVSNPRGGGKSDVDRGRALLAQMRDERLHNKTSGSHAVNPDQTAVLHAENDELKLYLAAVVRLLVDKRVCTVDEIKSIVHELDSADGAVDGKMQGHIL